MSCCDKGVVRWSPGCCPCCQSVAYPFTKGEPGTEEFNTDKWSIGDEANLTINFPDNITINPGDTLTALGTRDWEAYLVAFSVFDDTAAIITFSAGDVVVVFNFTAHTMTVAGEGPTPIPTPFVPGSYYRLNVVLTPEYILAEVQHPGSQKRDWVNDPDNYDWLPDAFDGAYTAVGQSIGMTTYGKDWSIQVDGVATLAETVTTDVTYPCPQFRLYDGTPNPWVWWYEVTETMKENINIAVNFGDMPIYDDGGPGHIGHVGHAHWWEGGGPWRKPTEPEDTWDVGPRGSTFEQILIAQRANKYFDINNGWWDGEALIQDAFEFKATLAYQRDQPTQDNRYPIDEFLVLGELTSVTAQGSARLIRPANEAQQAFGLTVSNRQTEVSWSFP